MSEFLFEATTRMRGERDHALLQRIGATFIADDYLVGVQILMNQKRYKPVLVNAIPGRVRGEVYALGAEQIDVMTRAANRAGLEVEYRLLESGRFVYVVMEPSIDMAEDLVIGDSWLRWEERATWYRLAEEGGPVETGTLRNSFLNMGWPT